MAEWLGALPIGSRAIADIRTVIQYELLGAAVQQM
jgi:hypothetical protein